MNIGDYVRVLPSAVPAPDRWGDLARLQLAVLVGLEGTVKSKGYGALETMKLRLVDFGVVSVYFYEKDLEVV